MALDDIYDLSEQFVEKWEKAFLSAIDTLTADSGSSRIGEGEQVTLTGDSADADGNFVPPTIKVTDPNGATNTVASRIAATSGTEWEQTYTPSAGQGDYTFFAEAIGVDAAAKATDDWLKDFLTDLYNLSQQFNEDFST